MRYTSKSQNQSSNCNDPLLERVVAVCAIVNTLVHLGNFGIRVAEYAYLCQPPPIEIIQREVKTN